MVCDLFLFLRIVRPILFWWVFFITDLSRGFDGIFYPESKTFKKRTHSNNLLYQCHNFRCADFRQLASSYESWSEKWNHHKDCRQEYFRALYRLRVKRWDGNPIIHKSKTTPVQAPGPECLFPVGVLSVLLPIPSRLAFIPAKNAVETIASTLRKNAETSGFSACHIGNAALMV